MKRAWPYAVALAVVVTGCYLALTPLLRSLSPGATTSSSSLPTLQTTATVGQSKVTYVSPQSGKVAPVFVNGLQTKTTKKKTTKPATTKTTPPTDTTGFATGSSSTQTPTKTSTVKTTKKTVKKSGSVSGSVDTANGGGLAGSGNDSTGTGGTNSDPAGN